MQMFVISMKNDDFLFGDFQKKMRFSEKTSVLIFLKYFLVYLQKLLSLVLFQNPHYENRDLQIPEILISQIE